MERLRAALCARDIETLVPSHFPVPLYRATAHAASATLVWRGHRADRQTGAQCSSRVATLPNSGERASRDHPRQTLIRRPVEPLTQAPRVFSDYALLCQYVRASILSQEELLSTVLLIVGGRCIQVALVTGGRRSAVRRRRTSFPSVTCSSEGTVPVPATFEASE